jgi:3,4-dihydroxy 2-butanone 4-phosphate synthase
MVRTPGHLKFFIASKNLVKKRRGHTELSISLTRLAGMLEIAIFCSMRDDKTGGMLSKEEAKQYSEKNGFMFLEGREIIRTYNRAFERLRESARKVSFQS